MLFRKIVTVSCLCVSPPLLVLFLPLLFSPMGVCSSQAWLCKTSVCTWGHLMACHQVLCGPGPCQTGFCSLLISTAQQTVNCQLKTVTGGLVSICSKRKGNGELSWSSENLNGARPCINGRMHRAFPDSLLNHCEGQVHKAFWNTWCYEEPRKFSFKPFCKCVNELQGNLYVRIEGVRINL